MVIITTISQVNFGNRKQRKHLWQSMILLTICYIVIKAGSLNYQQATVLTLSNKEIDERCVHNPQSDKTLRMCFQRVKIYIKYIFDGLS